MVTFMLSILNPPNQLLLITCLIWNHLLAFLASLAKSWWCPSREMCLNWRHRAGLVDQWNEVTLALTARLLMFMSGPNFPQMTVGELSAKTRAVLISLILIRQQKCFYVE